MVSKNFSYILVFVLSTIIAVLAFFTVFTKNWQDRFYDFLFVQSKPKSDVLIIALDNQSINSLSGWPLKRKYFSDILEKLQYAKAVGFDIAFVDNSIYGSEDDFYFKNSIENIKNNSNQKVIIPFQFDDRLEKMIKPVFVGTDFGFANIFVDRDGIVRNFKPYIKYQLSFATALSDIDIDLPDILKIDYIGKAKTFPNIPFIDVYNDKLPKEFFKNKIVLIGATSPDLHDFFNTPFGIISGVEIQANILQTLLSRSFFKNISLYFSLFLILVFVFIPIFIIKKVKNILKVVISLFLIFITINLITIFAFSNYLLIPNISIMLGFIFSCILSILVKYMEESKEKKFIKNMFQYYLTPNVVEDLIKSPEKLVLGGQKKEMVVFFSDIRDFTSISEKLGPEDLTDLLNKYLTSMTDIIMENKGVVDKYIGDAIMAFWGAPVENKDKVSCACLSVISMSSRLKILNRELVGLNFPEIKIGMGLNLGEMVVGNMGSKNRFNYTVMGDEVNFASRLEGLTKNYYLECLVSQSIYEKLKDDKRFVFRFIDTVIVKGKKEPKKIYQLFTYLDENTSNLIEGFSKAMELYISGDFSKAHDIFNDNFIDYNDLTSKVFAERCLVLKQNPPAFWNGVYEFKSK